MLNRIYNCCTALKFTIITLTIKFTITIFEDKFYGTYSVKLEGYLVLRVEK